ncbi:protein rep [Flavobacterium sp. LaA7.5]|nr:protein rep [Flavobacterium salilacus subsp. altitudinum]
MNTLAQKGTAKTGQNEILVAGKGTDLNNNEALQGRAKRKTITNSMMLNLIDVAKQKGNDEQLKSLWNTYHCQSEVISTNGRIYGRYCKNRFCTLCCSIRKAEIINKYFPVIEKWEEPYFVTLTVKACKAERLKLMVSKVLQGFQRIKDKHKKNYQRGKGIKLIGVKSLECNFNPAKKTYNPHLHLIVANKEIAEILIKDWLKLWTPKFAQRQAQDMREVFNPKTGLIEIIKYSSKIFTEPDIKKKGENSSYQIYVSALDTIFNAMKGKRIFDRFGFNTEKKAVIEITEPQPVTDYKQWEFNPKLSDWQNTDTDEILTGYTPKHQLTAILSNCIDLTSQ